MTSSWPKAVDVVNGLVSRKANIQVVVGSANESGEPQGSPRIVSGADKATDEATSLSREETKANVWQIEGLPTLR